MRRGEGPLAPRHRLDCQQCKTPRSPHDLRKRVQFSTWAVAPQTHQKYRTESANGCLQHQQTACLWKYLNGKSFPGIILHRFSRRHFEKWMSRLSTTMIQAEKKRTGKVLWRPHSRSVNFLQVGVQLLPPAPFTGAHPTGKETGCLHRTRIPPSDFLDPLEVCEQSYSFTSSCVVLHC